MKDWILKYFRLIRVVLVSLAILIFGAMHPEKVQWLQSAMATMAGAGIVLIVSIALCMDAARESYLLNAKQRGIESKPGDQRRKQKNK